MSDAGKEILKSTQNFREYLKDIGRLLSTAEDMLKNQDYETAGNQAVDKVESADIRWPDWWFPQDAFRFLHKDNARLLVVISVIIDNIKNQDSLEQPIVSAAWYKYKEESIKYNWNPSFSRNVLELESFKPDGSMTPIPLDRITPPTQIKGGAISSCKVLAVPLVDIASPKDIKERIITPLLESLKS